MKRLTLILIATLVAVSSATQVLVPEFAVENESLLSQAERSYLTNVLREQALKTLPPEQNYTVLSEESTMDSVYFTTQSQISQFGSSLAISVELYQAPEKKLLASFNDKGANAEELEKVINEKAGDLFNKVKANDGSVDSAQVANGSLSVQPKLKKDIGEYKDLKVVIDSTAYTETNIELVAGTHTVQISHPCYEPFNVTVVIEGGKHQVLADSLKATSACVAPVVKTTDSVLTVQKEPKKDSVAKKAAPQKQGKRWWLGASVAATYNDFYGTNFGFGSLKSGDDYTLKLSGADELLGNYWGFGANIGIGGLFLFKPNFGVRADIALASRRGTGESNVTVKLYWDDDSRRPEKSDLQLDYYVRQMNIDVPVAFRYILPNSVYAELGPMMSFSLYSKTKFKVTDMYGVEEFREHDCFDVFEFDAVAGVGMMRHIGKSILDLNLRFVLGVTPLNDADDAPRTWQGQFNIAYWFI